MNTEYKVSKDFYNKFGNKLIKDYLQGNLRMESAIKFVLSNLDISINLVLDMGCGIGWSSHEIVTNIPNVKVRGIDLSTNSIRIAKELFLHNRLKFESVDITNIAQIEKVDAIILIDVYEHILKQDRSELHKTFKEILTKDGSIILTCPTKTHQDYLRKNKPDGLQPVDEDVTKIDLDKIADEVGGAVTSFQEVSIWDDADYFYAKIDLKPIQIDSILKPEIEARSSRFKRVKKSMVYNSISQELQSVIQVERSLFFKVKGIIRKIWKKLI